MPCAVWIDKGLSKCLMPWAALQTRSLSFCGASGHAAPLFTTTIDNNTPAQLDFIYTYIFRPTHESYPLGPQGVLPDIVTMAKGIGNGLPLAAVVTTPEIAAVLARRLHFNTFGGNPVCSAGGRAVRGARSCAALRPRRTLGAMLRLDRIFRQWGLNGWVGVGLLKLVASNHHCSTLGNPANSFPCPNAGAACH